MADSDSARRSVRVLAMSRMINVSQYCGFCRCIVLYDTVSTDRRRADREAHVDRHRVQVAVVELTLNLEPAIFWQNLGGNGETFYFAKYNYINQFFHWNPRIPEYKVQYRKKVDQDPGERGLGGLALNC